MSAETAFGVSRYLTEPRRQQIIEFLRNAWLSQFESPPAEIDSDLQQLRKWFRSDIAGSTARKTLTDPPDTPGPVPPGIEAVAYLQLGDGQGLVTPEGRLLLMLLEEEGEAISDEALLSAYGRLADFYGSELRRRIGELAQGGDVRPNTFAFALFLLLNGSVGEGNAFTIPSDHDQEARLAAELHKVLDAFVLEIGAQKMGERERARLRSNWALTESAAQLPRFVERGKNTYWIRPETADQLPGALGRLMAKRRDPPTVTELDKSLDAAATVYREIRPSLAALGLAHDRPNRTKADLRKISGAFSHSSPR